MKKSLRMILLSSVIAAMGVVTACGSTGSKNSEQPGTSSSDLPESTLPSETTSSVEPALPNIASVKITGYDETTVLDGSIVTLKANVTPTDAAKEFSKKVDWKSSDETVATVANGAVTFLKVAEQKKVTITATSKEDATKSNSVEFTVEHCPVDLYNSKPATIDSSMFLDEGKLVVEDYGDVAMVSADAYGKKFYFEAEIKMTGSQNDDYPKFGLMLADNGEGNWCGQGDGVNSIFFYLDTVKSSMGAGVNTYSVVGPNEACSNWEWGKHVVNDFNYGQKVKYGDSFKMGILRNGVNYILYLEDKAAEPARMTAVKSFRYEGIGADEDAYVWAGGFNTACEVSNFVAKTGDAVDALYGSPTELIVNGDQFMFYQNDTFQTVYSLDISDYNPSLLTFESSDETVAKVSETGLVTAQGKVGEATITVTYGDGDGALVKTFKINATDDQTINVVLDGKMDDAIWSEQVKNNVAVLGLHSEGSYEKFVAAKNVKGVYMFADVYCPDTYVSGDWWKGMNFEVQFTKNADLSASTGQIWFSSNAGGSNRANGTWAMTAINDACGLKHISFEFFVPYGDIPGATAEDTIYCTSFGSNPGGLNWQQFTNGALTVTANGFAGQPTHDCATEGHVHAGNEVVQAGSCTEDGVGKSYCIWCGHEEQTVVAHVGHKCLDEIPADGDSDTCKCEVCEQDITRSIVRPITADTEKDRSGETGWSNPDTWIMSGSNIQGNFIAKISYDNFTNPGADIGDTCWKSCLPIIYDSTNGIGDCAVFRFDWWAWLDDGIDGDSNTHTLGASVTTGNTWCDWTMDALGAYLQNMHVDLTITRIGNTITLHSVITPNAGGEFVYDQAINGVKTNSIGIAFSCEATRFVVHSAAVATF